MIGSHAKIYTSIYDGSLVEDWRALITFQQMIVLCDAEGIIDMTPHAISRRTGIPIEHIEAGIRILENPDPYSRTQDENGKRIHRLDEHREWGWYIVNYQKYREKTDIAKIRAQTRERVRRHREKKLAEDETDETDETLRNATETQNNAKHKHKHKHKQRYEEFGHSGYSIQPSDISDNSSNTLSGNEKNGQENGQEKSKKTNGKTNRCSKFEQFWAVWPRKEGKKRSKEIWAAKNLDDKAEEIIEDVLWRKQNCYKWTRGFPPNCTTYLNQDRWNDERITINDAKKMRLIPGAPIDESDIPF